MSTIPDKYKGTGYGTIYGDSELRQEGRSSEEGGRSLSDLNQPSSFFPLPSSLFLLTSLRQAIANKEV